MPQCHKDLNIQVSDCTGAEITALWQTYIQHLNQIQMWGQGDKCPPPITASSFDPRCNHQQNTQAITVNA
eukprot:6833959-Prorocentrum_lima.AAC.1